MIVRPTTCIVRRNVGNRVSMNKPGTRPSVRVIMPPVKVSPMPIETMTYYVGKSIILFTMFYCGMNWLYYKKLNEEIERDENDRK